MSYVNLTNVEIVQPHVAPFLSPIAVDIVLDCSQPLKADLEWKMIYVGSAESEEFDQELESVLVGPIPVGCNRFRIESTPPDFSRIPKKDRNGVTVLLVSCSYLDQEFFRVGYYVNNYPEGYEKQLPEVTEVNEDTPEDEREVREAIPIPEVDAEKMVRNILADEPRVTVFSINWDKEPPKENDQ